MASASSPIALTGVFSSWETLAKKSRLTSSTRWAADSSAAATSTRPWSIALTTASTALAAAVTRGRGQRAQPAIGTGRISTSTGSPETAARPAASAIRGSTIPPRSTPSSVARSLLSSGRPVASSTR